MPKGRATRVIDGDTFILNRRKRIRLENVDAPEIGTKGAAVAKHALENLILKKTVTYQTKAKSYNRYIAQVKVAGKSVNRAMQRKLK